MVISAQGLYTEDDLSILPNESNEDYDGALRAGPGSNPNPPDIGGSPVGEGLLILTALAGGYAVIKKRKSSKEQSL
jgi:hypothetical protein